MTKKKKDPMQIEDLQPFPNFTSLIWVYFCNLKSLEFEDVRMNLKGQKQTTFCEV